MSYSMTFFLFALCFTAATASPLAARHDYPTTVTPTVPVPPATTSCPPTVTVPPVPPCTKDCTTPPVVPPCTKNCPPTSPPVVDPPCTKNCPTVPPCTKDCLPKDPVVPQGSCHPNFAGAALTLSTASGALSWSAKPVVGNPLSASSSPSKFFFQQTGFPVVSYTVKTVEDVNFALEVKGGAPVIGNNDPSGSNQCQKWFVDCSSCSSADVSQTKGKVASGCRISSGETNKQCVTAKAPGAMTLAACDGSGDQLFDFTAV